jgi:hypothetical protein
MGDALVLKYDHSLKELIRFNKKISVSQTLSMIPIINKNNNGALIIQTPVLMVPFEISKYNTLDISFTNIIDNLDISRFYKGIHDCDSLFGSKYKRLYQPMIIKNEVFGNKLRCHWTKDSVVFDSQKKVLPNYRFGQKNYAKFLLHIKELWVKPRQYGVNVIIIQAKLNPISINEPKLENYSFIDSEDESEEDYDLSKYKKMLKLRVPDGAIIQKMKLDKVPISLIFKDYKEVIPEKKYVRETKREPEPEPEQNQTIKPMFKISVNDLKNMITKIKNK